MKTENVYNYTLLHGLMFACPLGNSKSGCPFKMLRLIQVEKRIEIIERLSDAQVDKYIAFHKNCLCKHDLYRFNYNQNVSQSIFA